MKPLQILGMGLLFFAAITVFSSCRIPNVPLMDEPRDPIPAMSVGIFFASGPRLLYNTSVLRRRPIEYVNQRNFVLAVAGLIMAVIAGFFIYEFKFLRAPELEVLAPSRDIASPSDIFDVRGRTDPDADLTLNGRPLYSGATGEFEERVYLVAGVNRLEFEAKNRYGKTTKVTRYIVVK